MPNVLNSAALNTPFLETEKARLTKSLFQHKRQLMFGAQTT